VKAATMPAHGLQTLFNRVLLLNLLGLTLHQSLMRLRQYATITTGIHELSAPTREQEREFFFYPWDSTFFSHKSSHNKIYDIFLKK
jgi:hypothetical protein